MGVETLFMASLATTIGGGIVNAVGANFNAKAQQQQYQYQAAMAKQNADIARQNAAYQKVVGDVQAQKHGVAARQRQGAILAAQGASGLRVDGGSATDVRNSQAMVDRHDQAVIRHNAARRAYAYEVGAVEEENKASMATAAAANAKTAGKIAVVSSLLGTASSVSSKWTQAKTAGISIGGAEDSGLLIYGPGN